MLLFMLCLSFSRCSPGRWDSLNELGVPIARQLVKLNPRVKGIRMGW
jgi:hypothetical protein